MANDETAAAPADEVIEDITPDTELTGTTDWEAEAKKARGIAQRLRTKLTKATEKKIEAPAPSNNAPQNKGFDYGQLAYLTANGITEESEIAYVEAAIKDSGKSLRDLLGTKWFQAELKEQRDAKASQDAVPSSTKRSTSTSRDSVEYWIAKGGLPPPEMRELRTKVVNARIKIENDKSMFTDRPVV
jgi:hypothetical protein